MTAARCSVCGKPVRARGLCARHYQRLMSTGRVKTGTWALNQKLGRGPVDEPAFTREEILRARE